MISNNMNSHAFIIVAIRWLTLLNALVLLFVWPNVQSLLVLCAIIAYNTVLSANWLKTSNLVRKYPVLLLIDLTVASTSLWFTGATWKSPYYPYLLLSLVIAIFYLGFKKGLLALLYVMCFYTIGIFLDDRVMHEMIKRDNEIYLFSSYLGLVLVSIFFGFPSSVVRTIEQEYEELKKVEDDIEKAEYLINTINDNSELLSSREMQILKKLSRGNTNKQIAVELHLSENTVKNHLYRIYKKLGINSRTAAIIYYHSLSSKEMHSNETDSFDSIDE